MEYVFDPQEYGQLLLENRCMGTHRGYVPHPDDEVDSSSGIDINQALYKTEDGN